MEVAIVQPRLGVLWFVGLPLQLVITTGVYNGSTLQTAALLAVAIAVVVVAATPPRVGRPRRLTSPVALRS